MDLCSTIVTRSEARSGYQWIYVVPLLPAPEKPLIIAYFAYSFDLTPLVLCKI
jgi:hypothetical protein